MSVSKKTANKQKSKKGNKRDFGSQKLTKRETNFRIWRGKQGFSYGWYRTLPVYKRAEFKNEWYAELEATGKSPTAKLPAKYRA